MNKDIERTKRTIKMSTAVKRLEVLSKIICEKNLDIIDYELTLEQVTKCADKIGLTLQVFFNK